MLQKNHTLISVSYFFSSLFLNFILSSLIYCENALAMYKKLTSELQ